MLMLLLLHHHLLLLVYKLHLECVLCDLVFLQAACLLSHDLRFNESLELFDELPLEPLHLAHLLLEQLLCRALVYRTHLVLVLQGYHFASHFSRNLFFIYLE